MAIHFICIAGLPAVSLGCYGEVRIPTPNFDALADISIVCNSFFSAPGHSTRVIEQSDVQKKIYQWQPATLDVATLFKAAGCWLNETETSAIFTPEADDDTSVSGVLRRLNEVCPGERAQLVQATATILGFDSALGEFVDGLEFEDDDLLIVLGTSGDSRRLPQNRPDWLAEASCTSIHLPLLICSPIAGTHYHIENRIGVEDLAVLIESLSEEGISGIEMWQDDLDEEPIVVQTESSLATRSEAWLIVERIAGRDELNTEANVALFKKPEDLWEMQDVASQYPDLIDDYLAGRQHATNTSSHQ
ncbi:hypothetical protein [Planctomicrobium sp. SH527]|uniref:hypothetical protein n=1 Tax=Planctomicrobium sp. SH527 TaxID=3448123 RepID=UPI003F5B916F